MRFRSVDFPTRKVGRCDENWTTKNKYEVKYFDFAETACNVFIYVGVPKMIWHDDLSKYGINAFHLIATHSDLCARRLITDRHT